LLGSPPVSSHTSAIETNQLPSEQSLSRLTERQARECQFYEAYVSRKAPAKVGFGPVLGSEKRPWNAYWRVHALARAWFNSPTQRLLDFGCGPGDTSIRLARVGYEVFGFDVSPANVASATALSANYGFDSRTNFSVQTAESLTYPDDSFDVIVGIDILHHIEIPAAIRECLRVLAPGGRAVFHEPVEAPLFDPLRNSRLGRWLVPKTVSLDRHVTEDERKLTRADVRLIKTLCPDLSVEPFMLLARLDRFYPRPAWLTWSPLERLDAFLFRWIPGVAFFRGKVVLTFSKPPRGSLNQ
jgi:2-polyprenyl-3-methyl-5-hydroxy-6-metoxy-1,4-benzoquinol methylase